MKPAYFFSWLFNDNEKALFSWCRNLWVFHGVVAAAFSWLLQEGVLSSRSPGICNTRNTFRFGQFHWGRSKGWSSSRSGYKSSWLCLPDMPSYVRKFHKQWRVFSVNRQRSAGKTKKYDGSAKYRVKYNPAVLIG